MSFPDNPIATEEQADFERRAVALMAHPNVSRAKEEVRADWLARVQPSADMRACFDASFEEVMFGAIVWSLNTDPERPAVVTITRLAHKLGALDIPGSRWGIDNPDSIYRVIPIDGAERYVIRGKVAPRRLTENYFTLWDANMRTIDVLSGHDLVLAPDGTFEIFVDGEAKGTRANHIRSTAEAKEFYIRDVIFDWLHDRANVLTIERLGAPPKHPARTIDAQAAEAAAFMRRYAESTTRWNRQALDKPVNAFAFTIDRDTDGALRNQIYIMGHFKLAAGEALVLDVHLGGAEYFIAPITNVWGTTNEIVTRNGCLNKQQAHANPDGTLTFVVSVEDPGVHNWLDPTDLHEGILTLRWAEFPSGRPTPDLGVECRIAPLASLREALPAGTRFVTREERRVQLAQRAESYAWRIRGG